MPVVPDDHFLDANILLGYSASFDHLHTMLSGYFRQDYAFYVSEFVENEVEGVLRNERKETLDKLGKLLNLFAGRSPSKSGLDNAYEEFGYGRYATKGGLSDCYLEVFFDDIYDLICNEKRRAGLNAVSEKYQQARKNLNMNIERSSVRRVECSGKEHKSHSKDFFDDLMNVIEYEPDVIVVMDCQEVVNDIEKTVLLSTHDKGDLLNKAEEIKDETTDIELETPEEFL